MKQLQLVDEADLAAWAWRRLISFGDTDSTAEAIRERFSLHEKRFAKDVKKQATQIRHCLLQAREYWQAASSVGLATRPSLLYYSAVSLAYALVLFKRSGEYSFDRRRAAGKKGHHGLDLNGVPAVEGATQREAARSVTARPHLRSGVPEGTFADLLGTLIPDPIFCRSTTRESGTVRTGLDVVAAGKAVPVPAVVNDIYSLEGLIASFPAFVSLVPAARPSWYLGRCSIRRETLKPADPVLTIAVNECPRLAHDDILASTSMGDGPLGHTFETLAVTPLDSALLWTCSYDENARIRFPSATHDRNGRLHLFRGRDLGNAWLPPLATAYVILFQLSMLVRYYPDLWMRAVEARAGFAFLIDEVVEVLETELPLLVLEQFYERKIIRRSFDSNPDPPA